MERDTVLPKRVHAKHAERSELAKISRQLSKQTGMDIFNRIQKTRTLTIR